MRAKLVNDIKNLKKGQTIKVDIEKLKNHLNNNFKIQYNSIPRKWRNNDFYSNYFKQITENNDDLIKKLEKENPIITKINNDNFIDIIFSDGAENSIELDCIIL